MPLRTGSVIASRHGPLLGHDHYDGINRTHKWGPLPDLRLMRPNKHRSCGSQVKFDGQGCTIIAARPIGLQARGKVASMQQVELF